MARLVNVHGDFEAHPGNSYFIGTFRLCKRGDRKVTRYTVGRDVRQCGVHRGASSTVGGVTGAIGGAAKGMQAMGPLGILVGGLSGAAGGIGKARLQRSLEREARNGRERFWIVFSDGKRLEAEMAAGVVIGLRNRFSRARSS